MNQILGNVNKLLGKILELILSGLINIVDFIINIFTSFRQLVGMILSMGGCLVLFIIFNPGVLYRYPWIFTLLILSLIVPMLGKITVSYLKYIRYMVTEYFYDKADYYLLGKKSSFEKMEDYGRKYREDLERERFRREEERRKRQEKEFEEKFRNFTGGSYWTFGGSQDFEDFFRQAQGGEYQGGYNQQSYGPGFNQSNSFKDQYEKACDVLGLDYNADKYEIKLAYKKMAKMYHPDLNKEEGAKEKFQEINSAYEFLNDNNIQRYKNIN